MRGAALTDDEGIAVEVVREWLGEDATLSSLLAMNSSSWQVSAGPDRYALKISAPTDAPGLEVAAWLDAHGLTTGRPLRTSVRRDRLVALLEYVEGRGLGGDPGDIDIVGERWVGPTRFSPTLRFRTISTGGRGRGSSPT